MQTRFITTEIELPRSPQEIPDRVMESLQVHGSLLRWAITSVNPEQQRATVEAVVTLDDWVRDRGEG